MKNVVLNIIANEIVSFLKKCLKRRFCVTGCNDPAIETSYYVDSFVIMLRGFASLRAKRDIWANVWGKRASPPRNKKAFAHFTNNYSGNWYEYKFGFTDGATINITFQWANSSTTTTTTSNILTAKETFVKDYLSEAIQEFPPKCQTRVHDGVLQITRYNQWVRIFPQDWDQLAVILDRRMAEGYERHGWRNWRMYIFRHGMKCSDFQLAHRDIRSLLKKDANVVGIDVHAAIGVKPATAAATTTKGEGAIVARHFAAKRALYGPNLATTNTAFLDSVGGFYGPCDGGKVTTTGNNNNNAPPPPSRTCKPTTRRPTCTPIAATWIRPLLSSREDSAN